MPLVILFCFFFWSILCLLWFLDEFDAYIIVSFVNATLVLSIGETVEEVTDSGFLGTTPTLSCSLLGEDALVQVRKCTSSAHHLWVFSPLCHLVHLSQTGLFSYMVGFVCYNVRTGVLCPVPSEQFVYCVNMIQLWAAQVHVTSLSFP